MTAKRIVSFFLAGMMLLSLLSCSSSLIAEEEKETPAETLTEEKISEEKKEETKKEFSIPEGFCVGYDRAVVNPEAGTLLGGYVSANPDRKSTGIKDDIMLTCTAISDGENIFLFFNMDSTGMLESIAKQFGNFAQRGYGIPVENVIINATHTHNGPALNTPGGHGIGQYMKKLYSAAKEIMEGALFDLSPAEIYIGSAKTEGLNFVRRYVTLDGKTFLGNWPTETLDPSVARRETESDPEMQIIRFERGDKKDVVLCNWQCHPCSNGLAGQNRTEVSSDYVGPWREKVEKEADVNFAFFQGAAGNVVSSGKMKGDRNNTPYDDYGRAIADVTLAGLENLEKIEPGKMKMMRKEFSYQTKGSDSTASFTMSAYSIGNIALVALPCEWHDAMGVKVKTESPFEMTFISGYTNGSEGYIPASFTFDLGGYEPEKCNFARGTAEKMAEDLLNMLREIQ